jgi:hypothetical protein
VTRPRAIVPSVALIGAIKREDARGSSSLIGV